MGRKHYLFLCKYFAYICSNGVRMPLLVPLIAEKLFSLIIAAISAVASWLVRSSPDRAVRVRALAGDIVLCSWARHFTLTVPLSTQVYKWVPVTYNAGGNPAMDYM